MLRPQYHYENTWLKLILFLLLFSAVMVAYKIGRNDGNPDSKNISVDLSNNVNHLKLT